MTLRILPLFAFLFLSLCSNAQEEEIFKIVDQMPRFYSQECEALSDLSETKECAQEAMLQFIYKNIRYPAESREKGIQGMVVLRYVVGKDGSISEIKVLRSVSEDIDAEAIRVLKLMPDWVPGAQRGHTVPVYFNLPIKFSMVPNKDYKSKRRN